MLDEMPVFEMGLVMAGAVSAGAYSAGVIDFFVEALDAYETARTTGRTPEGEPWDGPTHAVRVPVMSGASAGGITAAMTALQVHHSFDHVGPGHAPRSADSNRLYASWVDEIDIGPLLDTSDLGSNARLRSVLCCRVLDDIVGRTLALPSDTVRPWLGRGASNALAVLFTVSDTGGVPYRFRVSGGLSNDYTMLTTATTCASSSGARRRCCPNTRASTCSTWTRQPRRPADALEPPRSQRALFPLGSQRVRSRASSPTTA